MGRFDGVVQLADKVISGEATPKETAALAEATKKLVTLVDTATMSTWDGYAMAALSDPSRPMLPSRALIAMDVGAMADAMMLEREKRFAPAPQSPPDPEPATASCPPESTPENEPLPAAG